MKHNNIEPYSSQLIDDLLDSISTLEQAQVDKKMLLAAKIADALKSKGWKHKDLLVALGKESPSVITKWLSGTHNFTIDTLIELEQALNIRLIDLSVPEDELVVKYHFIIRQEVEVGSASNYFNDINNSSKDSNPILSFDYFSKLSNSKPLIGKA
jgi:transcriptional regulator with XRE-family HTH domain